MLRCVMCGLWKPEADFAFQNEASGKRQRHCRACQAAYRRGHYLRNRQSYITREVARMRGYRDENRARLIEYLRVHPCVDCGESDPVLLEFDHRDPATKTRDIAKLVTTKPWRMVFREIQKCDVRCANCHRRRTALQFNWSKLAHGQQVNQQAAANTEACVQASAEKRCTRCGVLQPITEFAFRVKHQGTRRSHCRSCMSEYGRRHYRRNRETYLNKSWSRDRTDRIDLRAWTYEYLARHPCIDCGETDPVLLDFDHRESSEKIETVAFLVARGRREEAIAEVAKCDVRCANCHRRRTAKQFGWTKLLTSASTIR